MVCKFAELARSCFLRPCRVCSPVRVYFHASQLREACSLLLLATLPGLLTRLSLLSRFATTRSLLAPASCNLVGSAHRCEFTFMLRKIAEPAGSCFCSPSQLARASCDLAWSAHPCEFTFRLRNFAEPAGSFFLSPCRVCTPVRVYFHASQLHGASSLVLLATLPSLLTRASLLSCFASWQSRQARASCDLVGSAHPCEFTFMLCKFAEPAGSSVLRPCLVCSRVLVYFHASLVRRAYSIVLLATLPGLLTRSSLLSCFVSSPSLLARNSCDLAGLLTRSSRLLARASCDLAGSAHPCEFTFRLRKFAEPGGSFFLRPCRVCSPVSPSLLARASCDLAGSAHPCEFTFMLPKFSKPSHSCFFRPCRVCSPMRVYFHASQVRRACWLVLLATLPGLVTRASLLSCFLSSPSLPARASCDLVGSAHTCDFTFMLRKFAEPAGSFFLRHCRVCSPVRVYFHASQLRGACSRVLLVTFPALLTRASLLSCFTSSRSLLARASFDLVGSPHPCDFTFMLRKFVETAGSFFLRPCWVCSHVRVYFHASQVREVCSLVLLSTLLGLLTRATLLSCFESSLRLLARSSCDLAGSAHTCEFTFMLRKCAEPAGSFFLRHCRVCSPRVYFHTSQVRRDCWFVLLATLPGQLTRASLLSRYASTRNLLGRASYNLAGSAYLCEFIFMLRKFAEPARSCFLRLGPICTPVRVYYHDSQVRGACSLVILATLLGLLTRASLLSRFASTRSLLARNSCDLAGSAHPCEFTITIRKYAEPARSTRSLLARASCNLAGSAHLCGFTFMLRKFAEPARSCFLRPGPICSPARVYFRATQVRRVSSLVLLSTLLGRLTCASLLSFFVSSPRLLARSICDLAESAHPCEFTFTLLRRACWLVILATFPSLLTRASLLSCFASSLRLLARSSCDLDGSAHPCEFTITIRKYAKPTRSCFLQPCRVCSPVRVYCHASQVRRACSVVLLATRPNMLTCASLHSCYASSPSQLACASFDHAWSAHPCEFTFMLRKFAAIAGSFFLRPCRVCSPVRVYFHASQVRGACSLVLLTTLPGLLTPASLLSYFASSPSLLARASYNLAGFAHPSEFTFILRKFAETAGSFFLQPCPVSSPVRVYFHAAFVEPTNSCFLRPCRVCSSVRVYFQASSPRLLARSSCDLDGSAHQCEFIITIRKYAEPARSCFLQPCQVLTCAGLLSCFASSPSLLGRATCNHAGSAHPCEFTSCFASSPRLLARASGNLVEYAHPCLFTFMLRRFVEPTDSCFLRPCRVCSPVRVYFQASQVRRACWLILFATLPIGRACSLVLLATLPGLLTRASLLSCFPSSLSLLAPASFDLAGSAHPCEFTFMLRNFVEPTGSFFLRPCRACSPVLLYFHASQVCRDCWPVLLATLTGLFTRASLLSRFASTRSLLARASCNLARSSPVRVYFHASQVRRSLVLLSTLLGLLTRASLLSCFVSSPRLLARSSCDLAGSAHPCEFTFMLRKFAETAGTFFLRPCWVCSPMRVYFHASQVRGACSLVLLTTLPGLLTPASLRSYFASLPRLRARSSCDLARSAHPCEFTFTLRKYVEPPRSCFLKHCRVGSSVRVYFQASQVRRACWLVLLAALPGLLTRTNLRSCLASSPSLLARASYNLAGSAHPSEFTFTLRRSAEPARSCLLQPCRVCSPQRVYFHTSQVRRDCWHVLLATLPGQLTRASLLSCFASSPSLLARASCGLASSQSLLARASCNIAESALPCEFTFMLRKFAEPARPCEFTFMLRKFAETAGSFFLQPCRVCSPERVYFHASQVRGACSLVPLTTLPSLLTPASLLSYFASSPRLRARRSCDLAGSAHPREFTFRLRKYAEPARSCFLQPCRVCSPVRVHFYASQIRRAGWLVLLATLSGLLTRASLLSGFESSRNLLARASFDLAGSAHPCEFTFTLRKFAEPAGSFFWRPCRACSPVLVYFHASQVCRACWLVILETLSGLLTRASLLSRFATTRSLLARASFRRACSVVLLATRHNMHTRASLLSCFASLPSLLARASFNIAGSTHPYEFTFMLSQFAEPARSCFLQPYRVCSPGLLSRFESSRSLPARASNDLAGSANPYEFTFLPRKFAEPARSCFLRPCRFAEPAARASCDHAGSAHTCEFTFMLRKFAEPAGSFLLRHCRVCSPVRVYFHASQLCRACSRVLLVTVPGLLTRVSLLSCFASSRSLLARASFDLAGSAHLCEFTFMIRKFTETADSFFLPPCRVYSPVRVYFYASQVRGACAVVLLTTLPGRLTCASLLSCFASSPSLLGRASCDLARYAHTCEFTFMLRKFAEPARSCFLRLGPICTHVRVYFHASQVRRACSVVLLATWPDMHTRASLLSCFASSPSLLGRASCDLARYAHTCEFTFMLRKFAEPARSCFLRLGPICTHVRVYFHASQVRRACSVVLLATWPDMHTRASLLSCFASSPSLLGRASCDLARYAHTCEFTFMLRKFAEPARSCFLRLGPICTHVRVYFHASQVRRACSVVLLATWPDMHTRASLLSCFASSPSLLGRASCDLARYAHTCEFTFMLRKFAEPARSCFLRLGPICTHVRVYFHASQVRRACSVVLLATWPDMHTRASLLSCFASSPSLLGRASCDLARYAHTCEFTFMLRKFAEPARSCFLRLGPICTHVRVYFHASQVRRACSVVLLATWPDMHTRASLLSCFASSPSLLGRASCDLARYAHTCEFTFMLRKFAEPARSCFLRLGPICTHVRVYFHASQVREVCSLVLLSTLLGLLICASLLS
ncbi:hypothetical protein CRG98_023635 [Punica granatum]|uniref:Uncharacterized protein n=1 Tax=Punica granatum TaxID=22663 RepID=A0A2I0JI87_PUNGR|nr:hypothetical protein CRG98_023635 [Punica granatum]